MAAATMQSKRTHTAAGLRAQRRDSSLAHTAAAPRTIAAATTRSHTTATAVQTTAANLSNRLITQGVDALRDASVVASLPEQLYAIRLQLARASTAHDLVAT